MTGAFVSEWFVEIRSRKEDPIDIFSRLAEGILTEPVIVPIGLTIQIVATLDITATLKKPFEDMLGPFSQATK